MRQRQKIQAMPWKRQLSIENIGKNKKAFMKVDAFCAIRSSVKETVPGKNNELGFIHCVFPEQDGLVIFVS